MIRNINNFMTPSELNPFQSRKTVTQTSFADTLKGMVGEVNNLQIDSKIMNEAFIRGDVDDLHQVTISAEKARIGLELLLEIRTKLLEGYQEIMRMPI